MASGTTLGTGYVQIEPSAKGIKGKMEQVLNPGMSKAGKTSGATLGASIASSMTKYISAAAIGTAITKSLTEGAALQQSIGGIETLFKDSANIVLENANNAWKSAGISANEYMQQSTTFAASLLQSLGGDTSKAASYADMAIQDMADNANKMGSSIESIQNAYQGFSKQQYQLLDNLKLGYGGTKSEMERLLQDAEKLPEAMGKSFDINNLSDVYEAIHLIQGNLGITGTTAEEAAQTLSGSFSAMKAASQDLLGNLSMRPELVQQSMANMIESIKTFAIGNLVPALGNILTSIGNILGDAMQGDFVGIIFDNLGTLSDKVLSGATSFIDMGLGLIMKLADGIAKGLPKIIENVPKIVSNIANIINNNAPKLFGVALYIVKTLGIGLIKAIPTLIRNIPQILQAMLDAFMAFSWANLGKSILVGMRTSMMGPVEQGMRGIVTKIKAKGGAIVNAFKAPFVRARNVVKRAIDKIKGLFPLSVGKIFKNIKLPKIKASGGKAPWGILGKGTAPKFSVKWNAQGGIMTRPTIFGSDGTSLLGGGEAGAEGIIPLDMFWKKMDNIADAMQGGGYMNVIINLDGETIGKSTVAYINGQTLQFNASPLMV